MDREAIRLATHRELQDHILDSGAHMSEGDRVKLDEALARATGYTHVQETPVDTWTIHHNLGKYPSVSAYTGTSGTLQRIIGDVEHVNNNTVTIKFSMCVSGVAYLN